jgi:hypothetical protein
MSTMTRWTCVGCAVLAVACAKKKATLDQSDVQAKVTAEATKLVGAPAASATCPSGTAAAAGTSFTCDVTFAGGGKLSFNVAQTDGAGSLSITPVGDWLLGDKMESDLVTEMFLIGHKEATVDCGDAVRPITLPNKVTCNVKQGAATASIEVAVDAQRAVDWKLVGTL